MRSSTSKDRSPVAWPVRFSEFFVIQDGTIQELRIQYDPADYTVKGGS